MIDVQLEQEIVKDMERGVAVKYLLTKYGVSRHLIYKLSKEYGIKAKRGFSNSVIISDYHKELGKKLALARINKFGPESKKEVAKKVSLSTNLLNGIERGSIDVSLSVLLRMVDCYEINLVELLETV